MKIVLGKIFFIGILSLKVVNAWPACHKRAKYTYYEGYTNKLRGKKKFL